MPYDEQVSTSAAPTASGLHPPRCAGTRQLNPPPTGRNDYLNQTGDFKLEANVEYRNFGIMDGFSGAVFLDADDIWLLKSDPKASSRQLVKGLLDEIALGTGFGLPLRHQLPGHPRRSASDYYLLPIPTRRATGNISVSKTDSGPPHSPSATVPDFPDLVFLLNHTPRTRG